VKKIGVSKDQIVRTAIRLIEEHKDVSKVNLREIARIIGCSASNIYNYYNSYEELLSDAQICIFKEHIAVPSFEAFEIEKDAEDILKKSIKNTVTFALEHPGLYRLIYLDGNLPESKEIVNVIKQNRVRAIGLIKKLSLKDIDEKEAYRISKILHAYLHGEICRMISGRIISETEDSYKKEVYTNALLIIEKLVKK